LLAGCAQRADVGGADYDNSYSTTPNASVRGNTDAGVAVNPGPAAKTSKGAGAAALTAPDAVVADPSAPTTSTVLSPAANEQLDTSTGSAEYKNPTDATSKGAGAKALIDDQIRTKDVAPVVTTGGAEISTEASQANSKGAGARALVGENDATIAQGGSTESTRVETRTIGSGSSSSKVATQDATFVKAAAEAGLAEVQMGQLAQQNGQNQSVKDFGSRLVADHTKANQELMQIASQKGIQAPTTMNSRDQQMLQHLSSVNGAEFDKMCGQHAVDAHAQAVKTFKKEAQSGQDPEIKAFARKTLPTLEEHLKMARELTGSSDSKSVSVDSSIQK